MRLFPYYGSAFQDEFGISWIESNCYDPPGANGEICGDEAKVITDIAKCTPAREYLESSTLNRFRQFLTDEVCEDPDGSFRQAAQIGAKMGKKWCVDILLVSVKWTLENGPGTIKDALIYALVD